MPDLRLAARYLFAAAVPAAAAAGCGRPLRGAAGAGPPPLERLTMDRGRCFGTCPVYRVTVTAAGAVEVVADGRAARDSIGPAAARALLGRAVAAGVLTLPPRIDADSALCPARATDHATVTLTAVTARGPRTLVHYTGCYAQAGPELTLAPAVARLAELEAALDAVAAFRRRGGDGPTHGAPPS